MSRAGADVVVVGGGSAGLVAAAGCAALGARTLLVERNRLGGECTWTGCIPSKALLYAARQAAAIRGAESLGIRTGPVEVDFKQVMDSVRTTRKDIYERSESPTYLRQLGIRPLHASARFLDPNTVEIERAGHRREISFRSAIIATGSRPFIPNIPGLESIDYLTTNELFELNELPGRLAILGGGAVGVEMAQAFARLGSAVTVICRDEQLLHGTDPDASKLLHDALRNDGVEIHLKSTITSIERSNGQLVIEVGENGPPDAITADQLLVATGRVANTENLSLDAAGVEFGSHGIPVDAYCRTNVRHVLASGDVTPAPNLTHVGENMSRAAAINTVTRLPVWKYESRVIPAVVYTDPEIATVGKTEPELNLDGIGYDVIDLPFKKIDRAVVEHNVSGFVRVYHRFGKVLGATIAGPSAGEMIAEYAMAMQHGISLPDISGTMHAYPTMMLGSRRAADQFFARTMKPWIVSGLQILYGYRGDIPAYIGSRTIV